MPITQTEDVPVGAPVDLVAQHTLESGDYFVQNTGNVPVRIRRMDSAVADVNSLNRLKGHRIIENDNLSFTTTGSDAVYLYTEDAKYSSTVAITPVPE